MSSCVCCFTTVLLLHTCFTLQVFTIVSYFFFCLSLRLRFFVLFDLTCLFKVSLEVVV